MNANLPLITILGPTASGKTAIATHLAAEIDAEIISADSRQVYRRMDIGTGKDLSDYQIDDKRIPYHLIDIVEPGTKYNLFQYQQDFLKVYDDLLKRQKRAILCGGSGLYIESVLDGYKMTSVPVNDELRAELKDYTEAQLEQRLKSVKKLHNNADFDTRQRTVRAIEIAEYQKQNANSIPDFPTIPYIIIGVAMERETVCQSIYSRLKQRLRDGMIDEVQALLDSGIAPIDLEYYGLEYKFVTQYLQGEFSYNYMVEHLNIAIRQFAKRQMTWFRRMERNGFKVNWIDGRLPIEEKVAMAMKILDGYNQ
ncbi:MAG: tRNA (adenosine(37)-N6)-dimethylallyltransferase MiaA [Salinivirgaceae bacterium]|nr:tRNA (adenosine(37)-N6)-dimethylallyltransferase MiaA [Salinivirgaceae bacterium]